MRTSLALVWFIGIAPVSAAPIPKNTVVSIDYFPLQVGHKWVFTGSSAGTVEVMESKKADDGKGTQFTVKYSYEADSPGNTQVFQTDGETVLALGSAEPMGGLFRSPAMFMKKKLVEKDSWESAYDLGNGPMMTAKSTVGKAESITVSGKEYRAFKVSWKYEDSGVSGHSWYANGIGPVQIGAGDKVTQELKEFLPGTGKAR